MKIFGLKSILTAFVMVLVISSSAKAQNYEIHPYGGFVWTSSSSAGHLRDAALWGVKASGLIEENVEVGANFGYINHFQVRDVAAKSRGLLWEATTGYNFSTSEFPFTHKWAPFVSIGVGGLTTHTDDYTYTRSGTIMLAGGGSLSTVRTIAVRDHNTFLNISYGGGLKSLRLWGPVGLRVEVRGRTIPNYYHGSPTWLEATAGINFVGGKSSKP